MKKGLLVFLSIAILTLFLSTTLQAKEKPNSSCEGLEKKAEAICIAAFKKGCNEEQKNTNQACEKLAELYQEVTGEQPPW